MTPRIFLTFNPDIKGFEMTNAPDAAKIDVMKDLLAERGQLTQRDFINTAKEELGVGKTAVMKLLKQGKDQNVWTIKKGEKNSSLYQLSCFPPIKIGGETGKQKSDVFLNEQKQPVESASQVTEKQEFSCLHDVPQTTGKQPLLDFTDEDVEVKD